MYIFLIALQKSFEFDYTSSGVHSKFDYTNYFLFQSCISRYTNAENEKVIFKQMQTFISESKHAAYTGLPAIFA